MCPTCHHDFLPAWQAQVRADSRLPPCGETMQHHAQRGQPASYPLYLLNPEQAHLAPDCKLHEVKDCFACPSLVLEKIKPFKSLSFIMNTFYIFLMLQFCIFCGWVGGWAPECHHSSVWRSKKSLWKPVLSPHHVGPGYPARAVRLGLPPSQQPALQ